MTVRLDPPVKAAAAPPLDEAQSAAVAHVADASGHVAIVGEPGSGKTTVVVDLAAAAVRDRGFAPERILVLAATRTGAAQLRDRVSAAMGVPTGTPTVRTLPAAAFAVLSGQAQAAGDPRPVLMSGADQDVVLRDLLAGHARGEGSGPDWSGIVPDEALTLAGFRHELRDLIMRAVEADLGPGDLRAVGERTGRAAWVAAAQVYEEYERVVSLSALPNDQGERFDPAGVVAAAAHMLADWPGPGVAPTWDLVILDDAQDATVAGWSFVTVAAKAGAQVVVVGNADEAVQGYRGAAPQRFADIAKDVGAGGLGARVVRLGDSHRASAAHTSVARHIASRIRGALPGAARAAPGDVEGAEIQILAAATPRAQSRAIAARLRAERLGLDRDPVPWERMAVIARTGAQLRELRTDLRGMDIPCVTGADGQALRDEPAAAALLTMLRVAAGGAWTRDDAVAVLTSRAVGLDSLGLRRLRRALAREERAGGGNRPAAELLIDALADPTRFASVGTPEAERATLAARAVADGADAVSRGAPPGAALWAIWIRLGVAEAWRAQALAGSARDDADLDAVIALMRTAQQYAERLPHASVGAFASYVESQEFAADSLAARGTAPGVAFLTPAAAAGAEWDVVVVAGLEEGAWPNLKLRGTVLGAPELLDAVVGRAPLSSSEPAASAASFAAAREEVLADETRAFLVALTRSRRRIYLTHLANAEERPSRYVSWVASAGGIETTPASSVRMVTSLRDAVAMLRREAEQDEAGHAAVLARLALAGVPGADPADWYATNTLTSTEPLWGPDERVRVSPSKVEAVETCALRWVLEYAGARTDADEAQLLGILVHEIAEARPTGTIEEYLADLDARWDGLDVPDTWIGARTRERAERMLEHLAGYVGGIAADDVRCEARIGVDVGRARLSGSADRVHVTGSRAVVADLKTGKTAISAADAEENAQLAMYQLAVARGAVEGVNTAVGAELVYLGTTNAKASVRRQSPVDPDAAEQRLSAVVDTMTAANFHATPGDHCDMCPVRRSCPAQPEGAEVTRS